MVSAAGAPVEVLSCSRNGWSTLDQLEFLREHGPELDLDAVVIGMVSNDPDLRLAEQRQLDLRRSPALLKHARGALVARLDVVLAHVDETYGYKNWEGALYSEENSAAYEVVLDELALTCREASWDLSVMITPSGPHAKRRYESEFRVLEGLLDGAGIPHVNAQDALVRELGHLSRSAIQANPVNGHPGPLVHEVLARVAADLLVARGLIPPEMK